MSVDVPVSTQIRLSGSSGLSSTTKEVEMETQMSRSTDKTKAICNAVCRQLAPLVAAAFFALVFGQGDPSAKAGLIM